MSLKKKFFYFCFAGASGVILELTSFNLFFLFFEFALSKVLSLILALSLNFSINRNITFSARSEKIRKQSIRYITIYSIAFCLNLSVSLLMRSILGSGTLEANIATLTGIIFTIPLTFFGSLKWVFRNKTS